MIRLPPTSISLSDNEVAFHLQQIDIYHGLLKQGFKKKDILRYFKEHAAAQQPRPAPNIDLGPPALSVVQLAARGPHCTEPPVPAAPLSLKSPAAAESAKPSMVVTITPPPRDDQQTEDAPASTSPILPSSLPDHRHAPRQSSLLRFAQVASSSSSDQPEHGHNHVTLPARTFRPRTTTYSYNRSEASESELVNEIAALNVGSPAGHEAACNTHSISPPSWAEAQTFVPGRQKQWTSTTGIQHVSQIVMNADNAASSPSSNQQIELFGTTTPGLESLDETLQSANPELGNMVQDSISSSPPVVYGTSNSQAFRRRAPSSPTLPPMPTTPTPIHRAGRDTRTEPRHPRHPYLDVASFSVYNDALPAVTQPQTPAELSRRLLLTQQDAAYTVPPGMLHTGSPLRRLRLGVTEQGIEHGEQSPMAQAIGSRERRARELIRSVRADGARLQRLREQDRERIARGLDGNDEIGDRDGPGPAIATDFWRDEFEGDRIGDENWEGDAEWTTRQRDGMRVASGNARGRWWEER